MGGEVWREGVGHPGAMLPFIGRGTEIEDFDTDLAAAVRSVTRVVVLSGPSGAGKSGLLNEFALRAGARGLKVAVVRSLDEPGCPPLWCWRHVLDRLLQDLDHVGRTAVLGGRAPDLVGLVPTGDGHRSVVADRDSGAATFRMMDAVVAVLRSVAARQPVLVALDDAQWLDASSSRMLRFAAGALHDSPLVFAAVAGPTRDGPLARRVGSAIAELARQPNARFVELGGLSGVDVEALVAARFGRSDPLLAARILGRTDGNPLLVTQLLLAMPAHDVAPASGVPVTVSAMIEGRLAGVDGDTMRTLRIASVLGREVDTQTVAAVANRDVDVVRAAFRLGRAAGIIDDVDGHRHRFVHGLFRETLEAAIPAHELARLHIRAAQVLSGDEHRGTVAHHLVMAASIDAGCVPQAVEASLEAAADAAASMAWDESVAVLERAWDVVRHRAGTDAAELLLRLGEARHRAGFNEPAMDAFHEAAERAGGDPGLLTAAALGYEDACVASGRERRSSGDAATEMLEGALAAIDADDPRRAALLATLARACWFSGAISRALELQEAAADLVGHADDPTRLRILDMRRLAAGRPGGAMVRTTIVNDMIDVAERAGRYEVALDALRTRVLTSVELGRLDDADDDIELFARLGSLSAGSGGVPPSEYTYQPPEPPLAARQPASVPDSKSSITTTAGSPPSVVGEVEPSPIATVVSAERAPVAGVPTGRGDPASSRSRRRFRCTMPARRGRRRRRTSL